jgi:hypothetical protein
MIATTGSLLILAGLFGTMMIVQTKIEAVITGESGLSVFRQTGDSAKTVVPPTDGPDVGQARRMAAVEDGS